MKEGKNMMVREYFEEKISVLNEKKADLEEKRNRFLVNKERLRDNIMEIQENANIDFEIFSPRTARGSYKGKLKEFYAQINDVQKEIDKVSRELENVEAELKMFYAMLNEIEELCRKM